MMEPKKGSCKDIKARPAGVVDTGRAKAQRTGERVTGADFLNAWNQVFRPPGFAFFGTNSCIFWTIMSWMREFETPPA